MGWYGSIAASEVLNSLAATGRTECERKVQRALGSGPRGRGKLMSYLGLVPSEHSSGRKISRCRITKTGNDHARRPLIQAAWNYRFKARTGLTPKFARSALRNGSTVTSMASMCGVSRATAISIRDSRA